MRIITLFQWHSSQRSPRSTVEYCSQAIAAYRLTRLADEKFHVPPSLVFERSTEIFDITGLENGDVKPRQDLTLIVRRSNGTSEEVPVTLRIDTPIEIDYYRHGGILPFVLRQLLQAQA